MAAEFIAKTPNSEEAIYFLSLTSCSINKLKSHMLLTCKNLMFLILGEKKILLNEMVGAWRPLAPPLPLFSTAPSWNATDRRFTIKKLLQWWAWNKYCHCVSVHIRFCLVSILLHLIWIQRDAEYHSVLSRNAGKYGQEKLRIQTIFTQKWHFPGKRFIPAKATSNALQ